MRDAKTQYMKPWENFEAQANKLIGLYDEPIDLINGQIQAFEKNLFKITGNLRILLRNYCLNTIHFYSPFLPLHRLVFLSLSALSLAA